MPSPLFYDCFTPLFVNWETSAPLGARIFHPITPLAASHINKFKSSAIEKIVCVRHHLTESITRKCHDANGSLYYYFFFLLVRCRYNRRYWRYIRQYSGNSKSRIKDHKMGFIYRTELHIKLNSNVNKLPPFTSTQRYLSMTGGSFVRNCALCSSSLSSLHQVSPFSIHQVLLLCRWLHDKWKGFYSSCKVNTFNWVSLDESVVVIESGIHPHTNTHIVATQRSLQILWSATNLFVFYAIPSRYKIT